MEIFSVQRDTWGIFKHYHYLTSSIPSNAKCYIGFINYEPVCFVAISHFPHPSNKNIYKISRVVTLPHWQNYSIGMKMIETICEKEYQNKSIHFTTTLPIVCNYLNKSNKWILKMQGFQNVPGTGKMSKQARCNVYMETYKFINQSIIESDFKPNWLNLNDDIIKKSNELKTFNFNEQLKINKTINKTIEIDTQINEITNFFELI